MSEPAATPTPSEQVAAQLTATPAPPAPAADPDDPDLPAADAAVEPPAEAAPDPVAAIAQTVIRQRDAKELAQLVREKKQLEAEREKVKEGEKKLAFLAKLEQLYEDDPAAAIEYMLAEKAGDPERAKAAMAKAYDGLTSRILGVESKSAPSRHERSATRVDSRIEALEQKLAQTEAEKVQLASAQAERQRQDRYQMVASWISTDAESLAPFEALLDEADDPAAVVHEILESAHAEGHSDLTFMRAAELANEHFKPAFLKKQERRAQRLNHLSAPTKANEAHKPETSKSPNGSSRKSLTNADASQVTPNQEPPKPKTDAERIALAFAKLQAGKHETD